MLKLSDLRKTTRRAGNGDMRVVFPHLLRDQTLAPRIELALRYFESMVGRPRHEMDPEMVVQLFGDHKLARCLVECLAPWYRYAARTFVEELPAANLAHLEDLGITTPSGLRLWLYRLANTTHDGFVGGVERAPFLGRAAGLLGLESDQIEYLAMLDAPPNAVLSRCGVVPPAADVIARYNFETIAALVANAKLVRLSLAAGLPQATASALKDLCAHAGIRADVTGSTFVLHGRQDALNSWVRHGARLAMVLCALLVLGLPARAGEAVIIATPDGAEWLLRLDGEMLGYVGARNMERSAYVARLRDALFSWQAADALAAKFAAARRAGAGDGWAVRRGMDALVGAEGIDLTLLTCARASQRVPVVLAPNTQPELRRLVRTAGSRPLLLVFPPNAAKVGIPADVAAFSLNELDDANALATLLQRASVYADRQQDAVRLGRVVADALRDGVLSESRVAAGIGCHEDEVSAYFDVPAVRAAREQAGLRYVEGFGLCSRDVLERARIAVKDVAQLRGDEPVGPAWTLRVLGRKLREVTGVSEGIECLIAYLGAA